MKQQINPLEIDTTAGTQARVGISQSLVEEYAEAMRSGDEFPAPVVFCEEGSERYILADGFHTRLAWIEVHKGKPITCDVRDGTIWDAKIYAAGANHTHGQRRSRADLRNAIRMLLLEPEGEKWNDSVLADVVHCDYRTVSSVREKMIIDGDIGDPKRKKYVRDGKEVEAPAGKKKKKKRRSRKRDDSTAKNGELAVTKTQLEYDADELLGAVDIIRTTVLGGAEALEQYKLRPHIQKFIEAANFIDEVIVASDEAVPPAENTAADSIDESAFFN